MAFQGDQGIDYFSWFVSQKVAISACDNYIATTWMGIVQKRDTGLSGKSHGTLNGCEYQLVSIKAFFCTVHCEMY